jgi:hypothetical protein
MTHRPWVIQGEVHITTDIIASREAGLGQRLGRVIEELLPEVCVGDDPVEDLLRQISLLPLVAGLIAHVLNLH